MRYYWPRHGAIVEEAGAQPNEFEIRLSDDEVFDDYARVCLYLSKIPTQTELRIAQRELKTRTHTVYTRDGSIQAFQERFRAWLATCDDELKVILKYNGWARAKDDGGRKNISDRAKLEPQLHPFLPAFIQYLDVLARGEMPPFESPTFSVSTLLERRTADAFRCPGFEIRQLGQGLTTGPVYIFGNLATRLSKGCIGAIQFRSGRRPVWLNRWRDHGEHHEDGDADEESEYRSADGERFQGLATRI